MTRLIAGRWGGRRLTTPPGDSTRPTSDRVRESLFSALTSLLGAFDGLRVLDVYAGSGALGLEALSRGAESADFVEHHAKAAATITRNIKDLGADATVHRIRAEQIVDGRLPAGREYDLVFLDPPYAVTTETLQGVVAALPLAPDAIVVVERSSRDPWTWPDGLTALRDKRYGDTHLWYGH